MGPRSLIHSFREPSPAKKVIVEGRAQALKSALEKQQRDTLRFKTLRQTATKALARIIHEPPSKRRNVLCEKELRLSCLKHRANSNPHQPDAQARDDVQDPSLARRVGE